MKSSVDTRRPEGSLSSGVPSGEVHLETSVEGAAEGRGGALGAEPWGKLLEFEPWKGD